MLGKFYVTESRDTANKAIDVLLAMFPSEVSCSDKETEERSRKTARVFSTTSPQSTWHQ
ncbi:MAG: hypothetical protein ACTS73_08890 [Arsenophonus sp. NEOnobi-MAG3]